MTDIDLEQLVAKDDITTIESKLEHKIKEMGYEQAFAKTLTKSGANAIHLASKYERLDLIRHLMSKCSESILSLVDKQAFTPLFYAIQAGNRDIVEYLCSFKTVKASLNTTADKYGVLPIHLAVKKKNWDICEMLELYGAKIDAMVGTGVGLGETVLHVAIRDRSIETVEYIAKSKPGLLLKKNQQEENALFTALTDYRGKKASLSDFIILDNHRRVRKDNPSFLESLLPKYHKLFPDGDKAISQRNAHGHNILTEAIMKNDMSSTKAIIGYLQTRPKLIPTLLTDVDVMKRNIFHLAIQASFGAGLLFDSNIEEPSLDWLNPLQYTYDLIEESGAIKLGKACELMEQVDKQGSTPLLSLTELYDAKDTRIEIPLIIEAIATSFNEMKELWSQGLQKKQSTRNSHRRSIVTDKLINFLGITVRK